MNSRSLLFVNQHYYPDIASTGQHLTDLAEYLSGGDFELEVWCGQGRYVEGQLEAPSLERLNGVNVRRFRTTTFARSTGGGRLTNYLSFHLQVLIRLLFGRRRDYVVFLTTPPLLSFLGYLARSLRGQRYAIWSMDLHPEAEIAAGMLAAGGVAAEVLVRLNDAGYAHADFVVDLGLSMRDRITEHGADIAHLHTVSIWTDSDEVYPVDRVDNPMRHKLGIGDATVVTYSGNAGIAHRFGEVCDVLGHLANDDSFRFVFIGNGARRRIIEQYAESHRVGNFTYLDYFPRSELAYSLSLPDIHLITLRTEFVGIAVPGKLYGIMSVARPALFIGPTNCDTADVINETGCGAVIDPDVDPNCVDTMVRLLREWSADPDLRAQMGRRGRQAVLERYDREVCCAEFKRVMELYWAGSILL